MAGKAGSEQTELNLSQQIDLGTAWAMRAAAAGTESTAAIRGTPMGQPLRH
jgi:hypothetical protein